MNNEQIIELITAFMSDEIVEKISSFTWKLYNSLKEKGFTEEQAMRIVDTWSKSSK